MIALYESPLSAYKEWGCVFPITTKHAGVHYELLINTPMAFQKNLTVYVARPGQPDQSEKQVRTCIMYRREGEIWDSRTYDGAADWLLSNILPAEWGEVMRYEDSLDGLFYGGDSVCNRIDNYADTMKLVRDASTVVDVLYRTAAELHRLAELPVVEEVEPEPEPEPEEKPEPEEELMMWGFPIIGDVGGVC